MGRRRWAGFVAGLSAFLCGPPAAAAVVEEIVQLALNVKDINQRAHEQAVTLTIFRDDARVKSAFMVISHGRPSNEAGRARFGRARYRDNARYFVEKGFAVFIPTRIGYGITGGADIDDGGPCLRRDFAAAFEAGVAQVLSVIDYAKAQSYVDASRGLLVGQSFGGGLSVALSTRPVDGVLGAVNFAGGSGGDPDRIPEQPCAEGRLRSAFGQYGAQSKIPTLWLYSENDRYWGRDYPKAWFETFRERGGKGAFIELPPYARDGHTSFTGNPGAWKPAVEKFLGSLGFH